MYPNTIQPTSRPRYRRAALRLGSSLALALALLGALWGGLPGSARTEAQPRTQLAPAAATAGGYADVVVQFDDQEHAVRRVEWTAPISGLVALVQTGLDVVAVETQFGPAVCSIEGVGCPADDCFCGGTRYWSYNYWDGAAWQGYMVGAGSSLITQTGAVEGWRWGEFGDPLIELTRTTAATGALDWLAARQVITDGGYGSAGSSVETLLALGANREGGAYWRGTAASAADATADGDAPSLAAYLAAYGAAYSRTGAAAAGKLAVAVSGTDICLPGLALTPRHYYSPTVGAYSRETGQNSWAILGAVAVREAVPPAAVSALRAAVQPEGGWEWAPGWGLDTNATALAVQALIAVGEPSTGTLVTQGLAWLKSTQNDDGGFPYAPGPQADSDANSTAYVVQALIAAGEDPAGAEWAEAGKTPIDYLLARRLPDGSFEWQPGSGSNLLATQQAVPALLGQAYPLQQQTPTACPTLRLPLVPHP